MENKVAIYIIRSIHGLITAFFISCLGYIYYTGLTNRPDPLAYAACVAILVEGAVVMLNKGNCPLGVIHKNVGDNKTFFELFLPKSVAKQAVPFLGLIALIGFLLLIF